MKLLALLLSCSSLALGQSNCVTTVKPINGTGPGTTSETTCPKNGNSQAAANAAGAITTAGLNYFLVVRPAIQTARNLAMNAIEGQFTPVYEQLDSLTTVPVPTSPHPRTTPPMIKGHQLGESWKDFVAKAPNLARRVKQCDAEKRPDPNRKEKRRDFNPCGDVWRFEDNASADGTFDCMDPSFGPSKRMVCQDFAGEVTFKGGKLVAMKMVLFGEWTDIYPDIVAKFGPEDGRDESQTLAVWSTPDFHLIATSTDYGGAVYWMNPEWYGVVQQTQKDRTAAEEQHPNRLD